MSNASESHLFTCGEMARLGLHLSEMLWELHDDLGQDAVWKLTKAYGGRTISIPMAQNIERSVVTAKLGKDLVRWFFETYNWGKILVPMGPYGSRPLRLAQFRAALEAGKSNQQIAEDNGCHVRTVERVKRTLIDAGFLLDQQRKTKP